MTREQATINALRGHIEALEETIKKLEQAPTPKESCDDCMWSVCNYNKMVDCSKLLEEVSDKIEEYVCNEVEDHAKAQGMCDALTMIEDYFKENKPTPKESLVVEDCISKIEVIKILEKEINHIKRDEYSQRQNDYCDGFKFALELLIAEINKLPSVPPKESLVVEDVAERDKKLIEQCEYMSFDFEMFNRPIKVLALDAVKNIVKELPSVEPKAKTGHWIEEFNDMEGEVRFTCSVCGEYQLFGTDYCYHCGAKMVEEQGENT